LALDNEGGWRLRWTDIDNAPRGREVYWSSLFAQAVRGAGHMRARWTKEPISTATERALAWFNAPLLLGVIVLFTAWVAARAGPETGALLAFAMVGHPWFYDGFAPNYVDHHGVLTAASFGVVLGIAFMGVGWWRSQSESSRLLPRSRHLAQTGALVSAISGGVGVGISAASVIPTIAVTGAAAVGVCLWIGPRRRDDGAEFDGRLWRLWGWVGGMVALFFYFLEFAPSHMGLRMEVNHPLYAAAWVGGAEIIASFSEWRIKGIRPGWMRVSLAAFGLLAAPMLILVLGPRAFIPADPGIREVHRHIAEFLSLPAFLRESGGGSAARFGWGFALLLPAVLIVWARRSDRLVLGFVSLVALIFAGLACFQVRWWLPASGPQLCLLLLAFAAVTWHWMPGKRMTLAAGLGFAFVASGVMRIRTTRTNVEDRAVTQADAMQPEFRDLAVAVRASQPTGNITLLASPNASAGIGYFGGFQTLGTLYWENSEGLEAAAHILSARTDEEARSLVSARGITHIASISFDNFLDEYLALARPGAVDSTQTFGYRLLHARVAPRWLRPIPFSPRATSIISGLVARLFQVVPDQSDFEVLWNNAVAAAASHNWPDAGELFRQAIALQQPSARPLFLAKAGETSYQWGGHALAVDLLDASVKLKPSSAAMLNLAWILATSPDDAVRDGNRALLMIQPVVQENPNDYGVMDVFAAALAAAGQFQEATETVGRAIGLARQAADRTAENRMLSRLGAYQAGRSWRQ
jgi:tetratricopeptide (TPR) repeat protein